MGRKLTSGQEAVRLEESFLVDSKLFSEKGTSHWGGSFQWDGSCPMGRELPSEKEALIGKEAVHWEESFPVERKLFSEKGPSHSEPACFVRRRPPIPATPF